MSTTPPPPPRSDPPGVFAQLGTTKDAVWRLAMAHVELAKAEAKAIGARVAIAAGLIGCALALILLTLLLATIGTFLFLGEWLFGSLGWGVVHGTLAFLGIALTMVVAAIGLPARAIGGAIIVGVLAAVVLSLVLGLELANRAYAAVGDGLAAGAIEAGVRPLAIGVVLWAGLGLISGLALAARGTSLAATAGLVIAGVLVGAITAVTYGPHVGTALGVMFGQLVWMAALGAAMARTGVDMDALKARFYPSETIETSKETLEWLKTRLPRAKAS
ncbi:MAG: hypothetical protein ACLGIJ_14085 [Candidatus Limnocylindria bacterium]